MLGDCVASALASSGLTVDRLEPPCDDVELRTVREHPLIVVDSVALDDDVDCGIVDQIDECEANVLVVATDPTRTKGFGLHCPVAVVAPTDNLLTLVSAVHRLLRLAGTERNPARGHEAHADSSEPRALLALLSPREQTVLHCMMRGLSAVEIAEAQYVAVTTVRSQIRSILTKLDVRSQLAAVALAHEVGWHADGGQIHQF